MLYLITLSLLVYGVVKKDSKIAYCLIFTLFLFFFTQNESDPDYVNYLTHYNAVEMGVPISQLSYFEIGYNVLCKIGVFIGLSFSTFYFLVNFVGLLLITSTIKLFTKNRAFVLVLYFFYPFVWDTVQTRNFLAMAIVIFGCRYIIATKKNYLKYTISILIASTIHVSALFFLTFLLTKVRNVRILTLIVGSFVTISVLFKERIINFLLNSRFDKFDYYVSTSTSATTKIGLIVYFVMTLALVYAAKKIVESDFKNLNQLELNQNQTNTKLSSKILQVDPEAIFKVNIIIFLILGFAMVNLDFLRLHRNVFLLNYILFSLCFVGSYSKENKIILTLILVFYGVITLLFFVILIPNIDIFSPLFEMGFGQGS